MAYADRLKPSCAMSRTETIPATSSTVKARPGHKSPVQTRAKAILKKYRAHVRNQEFKRLKSVVPAVADNDKVSKAEILEETIRYIDSLHQQLLERIQCNGLPSKLREHANKIRLVGPGSSSAESSSNAADEAAASECSSSSRLSDQPAKDWTTANVATLMSTALEPQLEASLKQKRHLDRIRVQQIIRATTSSTSE